MPTPHGFSRLFSCCLCGVSLKQRGVPQLFVPSLTRSVCRYWSFSHCFFFPVAFHRTSAVCRNCSCLPRLDRCADISLFHLYLPIFFSLLFAEPVRCAATVRASLSFSEFSFHLFLSSFHLAASFFSECLFLPCPTSVCALNVAFVLTC